LRAAVSLRLLVVMERPLRSTIDRQLQRGMRGQVVTSSHNERVAPAEDRWRLDARALDLASWQAGLPIRLWAAVGGGLAILLPPFAGVSSSPIWALASMIVGALACNVWVFWLGRHPEAHRDWCKYAVASADVVSV
jgi:hypothetical protein